MKIAIAQMNSTDDVLANLRQMESLFLRAAAGGADLAVFPENSLYVRVLSGSRVVGIEVPGVETSTLEKMVHASSTALMFTTPIAKGGDKLTNATILIEPGKAARVVYEKIHLFDVDVPGAPPVRESDFFAEGEDPQLLDFRGWKLGLSICYDLRFAELYSQYAGFADLLLVPSAFLVPTGEAHWQVLLRARAIESQCYLAAPAQSGAHRSATGGEQVRHTYGHSLLVDPWGKVLGELTDAPEVAIFELEKSALTKVRQQIPMASHRRL